MQRVDPLDGLRSARDLARAGPAIARQVRQVCKARQVRDARQVSQVRRARHERGIEVPRDGRKRPASWPRIAQNFDREVSGGGSRRLQWRPKKPR